MTAQPRSVADMRALKAAREIAKTLSPAEQSMDVSIAACANLVASITKARSDVGAPAQLGHAALQLAIKSVASLGEALESLVTCHEELASVRDLQGLDESQVGCTAGKGRGGTAAMLPA